MIASRANPQVKELRAAVRHRPNGHCVVEGIRLAEELVRSGLSVSVLAHSPRLVKTQRGQALLDSLRRLSGGQAREVFVTDEIMEYLSETKSSPGVLVLAGIPDSLIHPPWWGERLPGFNGDLPVWLLADGVSDPGNLGTLIRSSEAFGSAAMLVAGQSADPYSPKAIRASMGSVFRVPVVRLRDPVGELTRLSALGVSVVSAAARAPDELSGAELRTPLIVAVGSEAAGVSEEISALGVGLVSIPTLGTTESLNVGVAGSIILYEFVRRAAARPL